jgi:hypothetical protein
MKWGDLARKRSQNKDARKQRRKEQGEWEQICAVLAWTVSPAYGTWAVVTI